MGSILRAMKFLRYAYENVSENFLLSLLLVLTITLALVIFP